MQKVLLLSSVASMIDLFNKENISILQNIGMEVNVACNFNFGNITSDQRVSNFKKELTEQGIAYTNLSIPRNIFDVKNIISSYNELKKMLQKNNYSLIHCHSPIGGAIARMASKKYREDGLKVIYTAHGFHFFKGAPLKNWILFFPIEKFLSRFTDLIITINKEDYEFAKKHFGKVTLIPGIGIDNNRFSVVHGTKKEKRNMLGFSDEDFILISVGQLSKRKNHSIVLKALSKIDNKKIKYVIVGFGELENDLKKMVKHLNISEQVFFLEYREDIPSLLQMADCFVFPSLQEGLPVSLMEAMAAGLPVICSKIRGNTDLINEEKNGFFFHPNKEDEVEKAIRLVLAIDLKEISNNNKHDAEKYDENIIGNEMSIIYKNFLNV